VEQKFALQALKDQGAQDKYIRIIRNIHNNKYIKIKYKFEAQNFIDIDIDILVNCNWVDTRWQYTFTHKQYIENHN
jgi:CHASE2 domain-containing sensor protein